VIKEKNPGGVGVYEKGKGTLLGGLTHRRDKYVEWGGGPRGRGRIGGIKAG